MGIKVKSKSAHESLDSMMRRFKRLCEKESIVRDFKKHTEYEKPSQKKRRAMFRRIKNIQKYQEDAVLRQRKTMEDLLDN
jgi:small subunit ribosomal protein S21